MLPLLFVYAVLAAAYALGGPIASGVVIVLFLVWMWSGWGRGG